MQIKIDCDFIIILPYILRIHSHLMYIFKIDEYGFYPFFYMIFLNSSYILIVCNLVRLIINLSEKILKRCYELARMKRIIFGDIIDINITRGNVTYNSRPT